MTSRLTVIKPGVLASIWDIFRGHSVELLLPWQHLGLHPPRLPHSPRCCSQGHPPKLPVYFLLLSLFLGKSNDDTPNCPLSPKQPEDVIKRQIPSLSPLCSNLSSGTPLLSGPSPSPHHGFKTPKQSAWDPFLLCSFCSLLAMLGTHPLPPSVTPDVFSAHELFPKHPHCSWPHRHLVSAQMSPVHTAKPDHPSKLVTPLPDC